MDSKLIGLLALLMILRLGACAQQSLPVGSVSLEDYYRRTQLFGKNDTNVSFTIRPVFPGLSTKKKNVSFLDTAGSVDLFNNTEVYWNRNSKLKVYIMPFGIQMQENSNHPYGWNDGPMIPAKGLQMLYSGGFCAQYGPLSLQFKPELLYAQNAAFSTFNPNQYDVIFARYYDIYNNIDLPVRFGLTNYKKAYWGQSSARLNFGSLSVGLSTENLWWGPGIQNSLLMSNTAPGFAHFTFNTTKPIKTSIGSFEWQIIAGRLENSGFPPLEPDHYYFGTDLYVPKPTDWRYLTGFVVTWQPKWTPGLFLGFDQTKQLYGNNLSAISDYLPFFSPIKQVTAPNNAIISQDHLYSLFMRWMWTQEHAELYFEWGQYNNKQSFLQQILEPNNSRAYVVGLQKILPFRVSNGENILVGVEVTQLQGESINNLTTGNEWYVSQGVRQGYTEMGQELGAGIGPGGNLQSLEVSWIRGLKKIGIQLQRYAHDNDFYYYAFQDSKNYSQHWTDLSFATIYQWDFKKLMINAKLQGIKSINYQWTLKQNGDDPSFINQTSIYNVQIQAGVTYKF